MDKSSIDLGQDLVSGEKLTKLAVSYGKITLQTELKNGIKINLSELHSDYCHWNPAIFEEFDQLFPSLRRVTFTNYYCGHDFFQDTVQVEDLTPGK